MVKNSKIASMSLDGGTLCLHFVNTVDSRKDNALQDYLLSAVDLVTWGRKVEIIDARTERAMEHAVLDNLKKANHFFKDAIVLRELLYRIFLAISDGKTVATADLESYNVELSKNFGFLKIKKKQRAYLEAWELNQDDLRLITAPVLNDSYALLLSGQLERIKECPNCGWLFLDKTRNGKRRWCSMKSCGSNVKALQYYYRQKER